MKLKIKNLYGIREEELEFDSENKKNIIIFAPNGIGKTSIFKGFQDIVNNQTYNGLEKTINPIFEFNSDKFSFDYNNNITDNILLLNSAIENIPENNLATIIKSTEKKLEKEIEEKIKKFHEKIKKVFSDSFSEFLGNEFWDSHTIIGKYENYLKDENFESIQDTELKIKNYKKILITIKSILGTNTLSKTIGEYYELTNQSQIGETTGDILLNLEIINYIKKEKGNSADDFGYWMAEQKNYIGINKLNKDFMESFANKYTEKEIELIIAIRKIDSNIIPRNKSGKFDKRKGKLKAFQKTIEGQIDNLKKHKFISILKLNEKEFWKIENEFKVKTSRLLKKANEKIAILNNFLNSDLLDWKIELLELKSLYEDIKFKIKNDKSSTHHNENFEEYASEGQKKILFLIVKLIPLYDKAGLVVMDDVMNSLDNQHANEFFDLLSHPSFNKNYFFIMTHNFEWLRSMAFNRTLSSTSKFLLLDKIYENKYKLIKGNWAKIQDVLNTKNLLEEKNIDNLIKLVSISSIVRETFANILISGPFPIKGFFKTKDKKEEEKNIAEQINQLSKDKQGLLNVIEFFDQYIRHYKGDITNVNLINKFNEKIDNKLLEQLPILQEIKKLISIISVEKENIFGNMVREYDIDWEEISSFEEYVLLKIFFGLQARFDIEYKKYYASKNEEAKLLWENEEKWSLAEAKLSEEDKKINNFKINYLAHANNAQWSKIIEFPIYKLKKLKNL